MAFPVARPEIREQLLAYIRSHIASWERPPTVRDMATVVGLEPQTIYHHLNVMEAKGMITRQRGYIEIP